MNFDFFNTPHAKANPHTAFHTEVTEVFAPRGLAPSALDAILESLETINRRQVRMETRLVRLMKDHGLDSAGNPTDNH